VVKLELKVTYGNGHFVTMNGENGNTGQNVPQLNTNQNVTQAASVTDKIKIY
jgi:hypothetical protein